VVEQRPQMYRRNVTRKWLAHVLRLLPPERELRIGRATLAATDFISNSFHGFPRRVNDEGVGLSDISKLSGEPTFGTVS